MNQKRLLPITEYFPRCEVHGEMNFTQKVNKKNWKCEQKECKNEREYLTQEEFLKMLTDSLYEVDTYDDSHYELVFFSQLLYVDIEIIYEILFKRDYNEIKNLLFKIGRRQTEYYVNGLTCSQNSKSLT